MLQLLKRWATCRVLAVDAHELANATGRTVYDSLYLALAIRLNTRMLTADERLAATVTALTMTAAHIQLVQTLQGLTAAAFRKRARG